jgi:hypothetical protein
MLLVVCVTWDCAETQRMRCFGNWRAVCHWQVLTPFLQTMSCSEQQTKILLNELNCEAYVHTSQPYHLSETLRVHSASGTALHVFEGVDVTGQPPSHDLHQNLLFDTSG